MNDKKGTGPKSGGQPQKPNQPRPSTHGTFDQAIKGNRTGANDVRNSAPPTKKDGNG